MVTRAVTYQEVAVVSPPEVEFVVVSPKPVSAQDGDNCGSDIGDGGGCAGPSPPAGGAWGGATVSVVVLKIWQAENLPKVHLRASRLPPATKMMPWPFPPLKTAEPTTGVMGQV